MKDLYVISDELLQALKELDPNFPLCSIDCVTWKLEHLNCKGCQHHSRCSDFVLGMEVLAARLGKR